MTKILELELEAVSKAGYDGIVNLARSWDIFISNE